MPDESSSGSDGAPDVPASVRAQLLATEHWSLLASRSTTQSEVLTRISIFLTLVSAGLVSLALVGQATKFSEAFAVFAIAVLGIVNLVGILTQVRVLNVGMEDAMYVVAMNRLRAAYAELDPGIEHSFMASRFDDFEGMRQTYYFFTPHRGRSQVAGSSMMFIVAVNSALIGLFAAAVAGSLTAPMPVVAVVGSLFGIAFFLGSLIRSGRTFSRFWKTYTPTYPSPSE